MAPFDGQINDFVKPDVTVEPEVFSLDGLIAWLEKQDPERKYDWWCSYCLLRQYLQERGLYAPPGHPNFADFCSNYTRMEQVCGRGAVSMPKPWTYGAALSRARALRGY